MKTETLHLNIVSAEKQLFSGDVAALYATGSLGELGIMPGHSQLITQLKPGQIRYVTLDQKQEVFYVSGGILEVQPNVVTILSDSAERAEDLDEEKAIHAKQEAERLLEEGKAGLDYAEAMAELAQAIAQIQAIRKLREIRG